MIKTNTVGKHAIGNGLYLRISKEGTGFFIVRYTIHTKRKEMTLGKSPELSLADAKLQAAQIKVDITHSNIDPLAEKKRGDAIELKTVNQLAQDWLADCDRRLKYPNIPRRVYRLMLCIIPMMLLILDLFVHLSLSPKASESFL